MRRYLCAHLDLFIKLLPEDGDDGMDGLGVASLFCALYTPQASAIHSI